MTLVAVCLGLLLAAGTLYTCFALLCVLRFFSGGTKGTEAASIQYPAVSVLKPVKGADPSCFDSLATFCNFDYPCYEVLFGLTDRHDKALPVIERLLESAGGRGRLVLKEWPQGKGTNEKVLNCAALVEEAKYSLIVLADSDMAAEKDFLRAIVTEYQELQQAGMITCLYKTTNPSALGSAMESLAIAVDFIPSVLAARRLEGVTFGLGASMLLSRAALDEAGGLAPIADYLADDYQLGFRLAQSGRRNELSRQVLENEVGRMTVKEHVIHQLRWARTQRASRPMGYLGYGMTHILALSLFLFVLAPGLLSLSAVLVTLALRYGLAAVIYLRVIRKPAWLKWLLLLPFRDCLGFVIWLWSFAGSEVRWRGNRFRILKGGKIVRIANP